MGKLLLLVACLACMSVHCVAQQQELDSLLQVLKNHTREDTVRLQLLNDIAFDYSRIDPAKGLLVADEAIKLAKKLNNLKKLASATSYKAMNYAGLGEDSVALTYYRQALAIHQQVNDRLRIATTYNNIAIELVNLSDYGQALEYHEKAFNIFKEMDDKVRMGNSLNNRGVIYLYVSDYSGALKYYLQALGIFEQLQNEEVTANTLTNIGLVYNHLSNFPKAIEYHQRAFTLYEKAGDKHGMINALGNLGNVYHDMDENAKALEYYQRALDSSQSIGDKRGIASNYANMGIVYNGMADFPKAYDYLQRSLAINKQSGDKKRISGDLNEIGKVVSNAPDAFLASIGISPAARFDKAIAYQNQSLELSKEIGSLDMQREAWSALNQVYEKKKDLSNALLAYKQFVLLRDSIINAETRQDVTRKEMQFEYEKKEFLNKAAQEKEQAVAAAALNRQKLIRNAVIGMAIILLLGGLSTFIFYKRKRDAEEQKKNAETEMQVLRLQMNPHFIFNSLNSINHYIDKQDISNATLYTTKFAKLMRMTLENSRHEEISLAEDLAALELYMQLEKLRMQGAFSYEIKIEAGIDPGTTMVPPMLLQPFVENSIWHGLSKRTGPGKIIIDIKKENGMIRCAVEDNGVGRKKDNVSISTKKESLGIKITGDRIRIINKIKKSNAGLNLLDLEEGFRAEITLPFES